jgi:hypothetical protein
LITLNLNKELIDIHLSIKVYRYLNILSSQNFNIFYAKLIYKINLIKEAAARSEVKKIDNTIMLF